MALRMTAATDGAFGIFLAVIAAIFASFHGGTIAAGMSAFGFTSFMNHEKHSLRPKGAADDTNEHGFCSNRTRLYTYASKT